MPWMLLIVAGFPAAFVGILFSSCVEASDLDALSHQLARCIDGGDLFAEPGADTCHQIIDQGAHCSRQGIGRNAGMARRNLYDIVFTPNGNGIVHDQLQGAFSTLHGDGLAIDIDIKAMRNDNRIFCDSRHFLSPMRHGHYET